MENKNKTAKLIDAIVEVKPNSFAVGKQIRDILWPNNLFVLSVRKNDLAVEISEHGDKNLNPGDKLHVRYSTYDNQLTRNELLALIGEQSYEERVWEE